MVDSSASARLILNPTSTNDTLNFNGAPHSFTGTVEISGLTGSDQLDLNNLYTVGGAHNTSFAQVLPNLTHAPTTETLKLQGGGSIIFDKIGTFTVSPLQFHFT